jgi:peroxiredoxin
LYPLTGAEAIGVDYLSTVQILQSVRAELGLKFPLVCDNKKTVFSAYQVGSVSTYIIVDKQGIVRYRQSGLDMRTITSTMLALVNQ